MTEEFTSHFTTRYDECAHDGTARASSLMRYTVETAFAHSAAKGFPLAWYDARRLYWLARRAHVEVTEAVPYGATLSVTTEVVGFRRIWARRRNSIRTSAGALMGEIVMDWIFTDETGSPSRIVPEIEGAFPNLPQRLRVEHLAVPDPPSGAAATTYQVPAHQIDPRGHLSTPAYFDLFDDALFVAGVDVQQRPAVYDVEFLRPSTPGDALTQVLWSTREGWMMDVKRADGTPAAKGRRR